MSPRSRAQVELRGDEPELFTILQPQLLAMLRATVVTREQTVEDSCCFAWMQFVIHQPDRGSARAWLYVVARHEAPPHCRGRTAGPERRCTSAARTLRSSCFRSTRGVTRASARGPRGACRSPRAPAAPADAQGSGVQLPGDCGARPVVVHSGQPPPSASPSRDTWRRSKLLSGPLRAWAASRSSHPCGCSRGAYRLRSGRSRDHSGGKRS